MDEAQWLEVRSVYIVGYPQPENTFSTNNVTYVKNGICGSCEYGITQKDSFYINKIPKWKNNRNFYQLNWILDELFISDYAKELFEENNITGIDYWPVKRYKKNEIVEDAKQIKINTILKEGLMVTEDDVKKTIICKECGLPYYLMNGEAILTFKKEIFNEKLDFYKTHEIFGEVVKGRRIIVSNKVYRIITENKLGKNLVFEPIKVI